MILGLDFVISKAKKYGIPLILTLRNNYHDFGGRQPQYMNWAKAAGVPINNDDDFYTNAVVKGYYKYRFKGVLIGISTITRVSYRDKPTIIEWELMNEPRCQVDYSRKTVNMTPYVKSIDNKHLLSIGMEGLYGHSIPDRKQNIPGYQVSTDFISNHLVREIDFATIHAYPGICLWFFLNLGKDPGYSTSVRDSFLNIVYTSIYNFARNGRTFGGGLVWQILAECLESYYDGYEIVLSQNPPTSNVIAQQSNKMTTVG
uniref:mannan endo-1,4-beta-mannosidase n=1 Tax=Populus trichocarpa TaxID=3694 RepID=A0A2K1Y3L9_POPTR